MSSKNFHLKPEFSELSQGNHALNKGLNSTQNLSAISSSNSRRKFLANSAKFGVASITLSAFGGTFLGCDNTKRGANSAEISAKNSSANATNSSKGQTMKLTQIAQQNYSKLFGDPTNSAFAQSDPEFLEIYANFAFDEVFAESGKLDLPTRLKLILGACVGVGGISEFKNIAAAALKNGVSAVEIKEIVYQATAYVGMARSLDFINAANEVFKANGVALPLPKQRKVDYPKRQESGLNAQRSLFGEAIDKANAAAPNDEKHIRAFLSTNCFGDYYTRDGLELKFRELLTLVILASFGGADSQVKSHVQGNLNIGHDRAFLIEVMTALVPYIGYPRTLNALAAIDALTLKKA